MPTLRSRTLAPLLLLAAAALAVGCTGEILDPPGASERAESASTDENENPWLTDPPNGTTPGTGNGMLPAGEAGACADARVSPGPSPLRRLTRHEYDATVRDLLGTELRPAEAFPPDDQSLGFDNIATYQNPTLLLAEHYETAAQDLAAEAVTDLPGLLGCDPFAGDDAACIRTFVAEFGLRAWRRPLTQSELDGLVGFYAANRDAHSIEDGARMVLEAMLMSPWFLYRIERGESVAGNPEILKLTDYEVATRLSYLLRGTGPDDSLLALAGADRLSEPAEIEAAARDLLERSGNDEVRAAVVRVMAQWIEIGHGDVPDKNPAYFAGYDDVVGMMQRLEAEAFLEDVVFDGDARLATLLTADHTFVNADLAAFYGLEGEFDESLQAVSMPGERSGLLTQPAVLAQLATENQSSPIRRGIFVRERLFCEILPPPPPTVDDTPPEVAADATTRERFAQHTADAACAGCHSLVDPIGFGLEGYDGVGRYREDENGFPIDTAGSIVGTDVEGEFDGAAQLAAKLAESEQVQNCVATQFFRATEGRLETAADACTLGSVQTRFRDSGGDVRELLVALATSDAFLYRSADAPTFE